MTCHLFSTFIIQSQFPHMYLPHTAVVVLSVCNIFPLKKKCAAHLQVSISVQMLKGSQERFLPRTDEKCSVYPLRSGANETMLLCVKLQSRLLLCQHYYSFIIIRGPCSHTRETVMTSAWQTKGVSVYSAFRISTWFEKKKLTGISPSALSCYSGKSAQKNGMPLLSTPVIRKGKNIHSYTIDHSNHFKCPTTFLHQMEDLKSWWRSWTVGKWCMLSAK